MAKAVFRVLGADVDVFLSLMKNVHVTEVTRNGQALYGQCKYRDLEKIKAIAQRENLEFTILMQTYTPIGYFLIGLFLTSFILTAFWSSRVWTFVYNSTDEALITNVHLYLSANDIKPGSLVTMNQLDRVSKEMVRDILEINFIDLNKDGVKLNIDINVRPTRDFKPSAKNITAFLGGVVRSVNVFKGEALVKPGDVILKGQPLIIGSPYAEGYAYGETVVEIKKTVPFKETLKITNGNFERAVVLKVGDRVYRFGAPKEDLLDWQVTNRKIGWAGNRRQFVELTLVMYEEMKEIVIDRSLDEAIYLAQKKAEDSFNHLYADSVIKDKKITSLSTDDGVTVILQAKIETDLSRERPGGEFE